MKKITKSDCIKLLKRDLVNVPAHNKSISYEYTTQDNLIVTITTKTKIRRNYTFGGPIYCAVVNFSDPNIVKVDFLSPLKRPYNINYSKIIGITFRFI